MNFKKLKPFHFIIIGSFIFWAIIYLNLHNSLGRIMVLSVSSNGDYAVSTDDNKRMVLWDLKKHQYRIIDHNANLYSAYFIKNTNNFMWQHDSDNEVYIKNVSGESIQHFNPGFPTYGEVMTSDLKTYIASDEDWNLYKIKDNKKIQLMKDDDGFFGYGKLLNLNLSKDDKYLLTSGNGDRNHNNEILNLIGKKLSSDKYVLDSVVLWDLNKNIPILEFPGNVSKTFASLSPDGQYVLGGDENSWGYIWNTKTGEKIFDLWYLFSGIPIKQNNYGENIAFNSQGLISAPRDFIDFTGNANDFILTMKFITQTYYLRFTTGIPYAILYEINNPKPLKYIKLSEDIYPSINEYARDQSIDTAPNAHVLVMGHQYKPGITVYYFDSKKQMLTKIWEVD